MSVCALSLFDANEVNCHDLNYFTITSTSLCVVYLYSIGGRESQGSSYSVQPTAPDGGYVDGYTHRMFTAHTATKKNDWLWWSGSNVMSYVSMKGAIS